MALMYTLVVELTIGIRALLKHSNIKANMALTYKDTCTHTRRHAMAGFTCGMKLLPCFSQCFEVVLPSLSLSPFLSLLTQSLTHTLSMYNIILLYQLHVQYNYVHVCVPSYIFIFGVLSHYQIAYQTKQPSPTIATLY